MRNKTAIDDDDDDTPLLCGSTEHKHRHTTQCTAVQKNVRCMRCQLIRIGSAVAVAVAAVAVVPVLHLTTDAIVKWLLQLQCREQTKIYAEKMQNN